MLRGLGHATGKNHEGFRAVERFGFGVQGTLHQQTSIGQTPSRKQPVTASTAEHNTTKHLPPPPQPKLTPKQTKNLIVHPSVHAGADVDPKDTSSKRYMVFKLPPKSHSYDLKFKANPGFKV